MANQRPSGPANTRPVETLQLSEDTVQPQLGSDKWWHIAFGGMLLVAVIYFGVWTSQHVPSSANYFVLAITVILVFSWPSISAATMWRTPSARQWVLERLR